MLLRFCQGTKVCSPRIAQECREERLCSHSCRRQSGTTIACEIAKSVQTPEVGAIEDVLAINIEYMSVGKKGDLLHLAAEAESVMGGWATGSHLGKFQD